jgi:hypothetical protein
MRQNWCWCYACNKHVLPTQDLNCPDCHEDYLEYDEPPADRFPFPFAGFDPFRFLNDILNPNPDQNVPQNDTPIANWFRTIVGRVGRLITGEDGHQMGDFFAGNAEQWQALADRLFRLDGQSLGSPPTSETFVKSLTPVKYEKTVTVDETCVICLEPFVQGTDVLVLPCKHGFHPDCISPWLKMHSECPNCRYRMPS